LTNSTIVVKIATSRKQHVTGKEPVNVNIWNGKRKALTFSYDDGVVQDIRLAQLLNRHGLKCTFNLNSGFFEHDRPWNYKGVDVRRGNIAQLKEHYIGHEVASHSVSHPNLADMPMPEIFAEISRDVAALEKAFSTKVWGLAYPFGGYNETVMQVAANCGLHYGRTGGSSYSFNLPFRLFEMQPTCHHNDSRLNELVDHFLEASPEADSPMLFNIYGHSYEFDADDNWHVFEALCEKLAARDDVFYGTYAQVLGLDMS